MELTLKGFERVNEYTDSELLKVTELTRLRNMILSGGKAEKRGGFTRFNSNDAGFKIHSLHDVIDSNGNGCLLAVGGDEDGDSDGSVKKSLDGSGSWSAISGTAGIDDSTRMRMAQFAQNIVMTNNVDVPIITNLTNSWSLDIDAAASNIIVSAHTTTAEGNLTPNANYKYIIVFTTADGNRSIISYPFTHYRDNIGNKSTDATHLKLFFSSITASPDTRVTDKLIYRTKGNGNVFYFHSRIPNDQTYFFDDVSDDQLDLSDTIDYYVEIKKAKNLLVNDNKLIFTNTTRTEKNIVKQPTVAGANSSPPSGYAVGTYVDVEGVASTVSGSGLTASSTYKYRFELVTEDGLRSNYLEITTTTGVGENYMTLYHVPGYDDEGVKTIVYRTGADGSTFYKLDQDFTPAIGTQQAYDECSDANLGDEYVALSDVNYKNELLISETNRITTFPILNSIWVFPDDNDEIMALVNDPDGFLVFKKNSICKVFTRGEAINWQIVRWREGIGTDEPDSVVKDNEHVYFMNHGEVYRYPDYMETPLSLPITDSISAITTVKDSAYINSLNWYVLIGETTSYKRVMFVFDTRMNSWYRFDMNSYSAQWSCVIEAKGSNRGSIIIGHDQDGYLDKYTASSEVDYAGNEYLLDEAGNRLTDEAGNDLITETSNMNIEIEPSIWTKVFTIPNSMAFTRIRELIVDYVKKNGKNLSVMVEDVGDGTYRSGSDSTDSSNTNLSKVKKFVTDSLSGTLKYGTRLRIRLSGSGLKSLNALKLSYRLENRGRKYE